MAKHVVAGVVLALLALSALPAQAQLFSRDNAENADAGAVAAGKTGPKVTIVLGAFAAGGLLHAAQ